MVQNNNNEHHIIFVLEKMFLSTNVKLMGILCFVHGRFTGVGFQHGVTSACIVSK